MLFTNGYFQRPNTKTCASNLFQRSSTKCSRLTLILQAYCIYMNNRQPLKQLRFKSQNTIKQLSNGFRKYEPNGSAESYFVDVLLEICCKEV